MVISEKIYKNAAIIHMTRYTFKTFNNVPTSEHKKQTMTEAQTSYKQAVQRILIKIRSGSEL